MNFVTVKFELKDGTIASTLVDETKADIVIKKLNISTKAWVSEV